jgi:L-alanine-DL-glutamate epimerase-like enolase superfamily enzyme
MATATRPTVEIDGLDVSAYTIPTDQPEQDGTLDWNSTTIVVVEANGGGETGLGWTYGPAAVADLVSSKLASTVRRRSALDVQGCWAAMNGALRQAGQVGIAAMAISAVDVALWDLKARLLEVPLCSLLGRYREGVPIYGSGGFTSYSNDDLKRQLSGWVEQGITRVKMKVGRQPDRDPERVAAAREAIGAEPELFVDANGAYTRRQAMELAARFGEYGVSWFEEPVSSDDLTGLRQVRERTPAWMEVAAGEYGWDLFYFERMLEAEAVDVLQADVTRCGGITGLLGADRLCKARALPSSAHCAPSIHAHAGCAMETLVHLEYFHDHTRIEGMLFDGTLDPQDGVLTPDLSRHGLGLELKRGEAERFA